MIANKLAIPPRVPGRIASATPIIPASIARSANTNPSPPLLKKLKTAATKAKIEKMLKLARGAVCVFIILPICGDSKLVSSVTTS
jgi:hypothetical protein